MIHLVDGKGVSKISWSTAFCAMTVWIMKRMYSMVIQVGVTQGTQVWCNSSQIKCFFGFIFWSWPDSLRIILKKTLKQNNCYHKDDFSYEYFLIKTLYYEIIRVSKRFEQVWLWAINRGCYILIEKKTREINGHRGDHRWCLLEPTWRVIFLMWITAYFRP
jgi:hypothetical protein